MLALTFSFLLLGSTAVASDRIVLENGTVIEAVGYTEADDVLEVDLGFQKLQVPRSAVVEILPPEPPGLYRDSDGAPERELNDNVVAVGEAVVLVRTPVALGSGFVIHPEGYVITNDHVIEGSTELTVVVYRQATDGLRKDEYKKIRIVATSELLDLALIKIEPEEPEEFVTVPLGNSNSIEQGQGTFALGNPQGLERSVSEGIVALRSRLVRGQSYVQTTAPISPGNSGGPLFNMSGEVIGVNTLKNVAMGSEGLGFSIPVNRVKAFIEDQEAFAFDTLNANSGHRYYSPPRQDER